MEQKRRERKGREGKGREGKEKEREGKERKGKERKGTERKGKKERKKERERPPVNLFLIPSRLFFLVCSWSLVVLGGLMVGGGWKSIALNNEPQGSTLAPLSPRSGAVSHASSHSKLREKAILSPSRTFPRFLFPSLFSFLRSPSLLCATRGLPIPSPSRHPKGGVCVLS